MKDAPSQDRQKLPKGEINFFENAEQTRERTKFSKRQSEMDPIFRPVAG